MLSIHYYKTNVILNVENNRYYITNVKKTPNMIKLHIYITFLSNNKNIRTVMRYGHSHLPLAHVKEPYRPDYFSRNGEQL